LTRKIIYIILLISPLWCHAQIVIDRSSLPDFGDTILYKTDRSPKIEISGIGEDQQWDFSKLTSPYSDEVSFSSPEALSEDADMVVKQNGELLFLLKWKQSDLLITGQFKREDMSKQVSHLSKFTTPAIFRKEQLAFGQAFNEEYTRISTYNVNEISFEVLNGLTEIPDSIRIMTKTIVKHEVDAWGKLSLPIFKHDVLRVKVDQTEEVSYIAIKDGVESQIAQNGFMDQFINTYITRNVSYHYYSASSKMPIVIVDTDTRGEVTQATYQLNKRIHKIAKPFDERTGLSIYPNPTIGPVRFDFFGYPPGKYKIHIFNSILKELWAETIVVEVNGVIDLDLGFLQKGTYIYGIENERGERLVTKKILIINP